MATTGATSAAGTRLMSSRLHHLLVGSLRTPSVVVDVVAFLTLILAAIGASSVVTGSAGILVIAAGAAAHYAERSYRASTPMLGRFVLPRVMLLACVALVAVGRDMSPAFWLSLVVTGLAIIGEVIVASVVTYAAPYAANFVGARTLTRVRLPQWPSIGLTVGALIAGFLEANGTDWLISLHATLALGAMLWLIAIAVAAWTRIIARQRFIHELPAWLGRVAPEFVLHWDATPGTAYQVGMWLPELERLERPYFILVRSPQCFEEVLGLTKRPVLFLRYLEDLDACIVPTLKAAFYVNNGIRNSHLVRFTQLKHVQLNHGESDKTPSFNPVFRMYDYEFVAGQAAVDRFADNGVWMPPHMFRIVGRPQVREITSASTPIAQVPRPTVLYAPTWAGFNDDSRYSSLPYSGTLLEVLLDRGCRVVFRPHPYSYRSLELAAECRAIQRRLADHARTTGIAHVFGAEAEQTMSLVECFNVSDALISDVSSVVADYLYSEKPLAMTAISEPRDAFREHYPIARASYLFELHDGAIVDVQDTVTDLLTDAEFADARRAMKRYYLGDIPDSEYAQRFVDEAIAVIDGP